MDRRRQPSQGAQPTSRTHTDRIKNKTVFRELLEWVVPQGDLFANANFHGNVNWNADQVAVQALIWAWQDSRNVTDAFDQTLEICEDLGLQEMAKTYPTFMNALHRYADTFGPRLRERFQTLAKEVGGKRFRTDGWVLIGFDGSRATAPRSVSNEEAFCAPNYGNGTRAKYGKKKSKGLRKKRNKQQNAQPPMPQAWITMMWHMGLRLPWTWRLGPSNSSERDHVKEMLEQEEFPRKTLFCGDAGFVGCPLWSAITAKKNRHFLVRVGANVTLLTEKADIKKRRGGVVLCWPKGRMNSGDPPLRLRLVQVRVGKTKMWMLTSVLDPQKLSKKQIVKFYKMRWGIEVEFRGLKQTIDRHKLRCRNSDRLLAELDWSIFAMGFAELIGLREQIPNAAEKGSKADYDPRHRSLANLMRALRKCMRRLHMGSSPEDGLQHDLAQAKVQQYHNRTDKKARYRPGNPDKKPLGDPVVMKMDTEQRRKLRMLDQKMAA